MKLTAENTLGTANPSSAGAAELAADAQSSSRPESPLLHFESLHVGDRWFSPWREISGDDVAEFAVLTGDEDPLHTTAAADSPFGRPVAHGLLGLSLMAGLSSQHPRVATLALTEVSGWKFEKPVFFGDQIRVMTEVESLQSHGRRAGKVVWKRQLINQDGRVVQQGRIVSLVARGERLRSNTETARLSSASTEDTASEKTASGKSTSVAPR